MLAPHEQVDELEQNVNQIKQRLRRQQIPKKHAPQVPPELLITLSGCAFKVHKQSARKLVLKADEKANFENDVNVLRSVSYIAGVYDAVSVYGWDWRVIRYDGSKLILRPLAPTISL